MRIPLQHLQLTARLEAIGEQDERPVGLQLKEIEIWLGGVESAATSPTLRTIGWGMLRHNNELEPYEIATIVNVFVFALLFVIYILIRIGTLRLGVPED
jgi:hypothetical protein